MQAKLTEEDKSPLSHPGLVNGPTGEGSLFFFSPLKR